MPERRRRRHAEEVPDDDEDDKYYDDDYGYKKDEDADPPRRRRRTRPADEDEDEPKRRRSRGDDEDDEDEPPRRRRRAKPSDDDEEDEAPRSRRRRSRDDDDDEDVSEYKSRSRRRSRDDDEEDDDEEDAANADDIFLPGWDGQRAAATRTGSFTDSIIDLKKSGDDGAVIVFLEDEPFASYNEHWLEGKGKQRSYVCIGESCPLCKHLSDANLTQVTMFNIGVVTTNKPINMILRGRKRLSEAVARANNSPKGPLTNGYWHIRQTGVKQNTNFEISHVKERDLGEDFGLDPITDDEFDRLEEKKFTRKVLRVPKRSELMQVVEDYLD